MSEECIDEILNTVEKLGYYNYTSKIYNGCKNIKELEESVSIIKRRYDIDLVRNNYKERSGFNKIIGFGRNIIVYTIKI